MATGHAVNLLDHFWSQPLSTPRMRAANGAMLSSKFLFKELASSEKNTLEQIQDIARGV